MREDWIPDTVDLELGLDKISENISQNIFENEENPNYTSQEPPCIANDKALITVKYQILLRLVLQLQSRWRGARRRRAMGPVLEKMRQDKARREKFLAILYESPPVESPPVDDTCSDDSSVKSSLLEDSGAEVAVDVSPMEQLSAQIAGMNRVKSLLIRFLTQRKLGQLLAQLLVDEVARKNALPPQSNDSALLSESDIEFDVESVDLLLPREVGAQEMKWMVQEVTDTERYELQFERLRFAATKIQRFFRRFLTRQKFLAYINEKTLSTVWAEKEQLRQEAEERGEEPPGMDEVINHDAINTEGCPVM